MSRRRVCLALRTGILLPTRATTSQCCVFLHTFSENLLCARYHARCWEYTHKRSFFPTSSSQSAREEKHANIVTII